MALPFLEAMRLPRAQAQTAKTQRFFALFYPNGTDPRKWNPAAGPLTAASVPECLKDLNGFSAEVLGQIRAMGYEPAAESFGYARLYMIVRKGGRWIGAADPRHDGEVRGW